LLPLSPATNERLAALHTKTTGKRSRLNLEEMADDTSVGDEQNRQKLLEFRQWRDSIARPVFSSVVHELRSHGHRARVLMRSSESVAGSETIELRGYAQRLAALPSVWACEDFRVPTQS
jgi:hypothetical protein